MKKELSYEPIATVLNVTGHWIIVIILFNLKVIEAKKEYINEIFFINNLILLLFISSIIYLTFAVIYNAINRRKRG